MVIQHDGDNDHLWKRVALSCKHMLVQPKKVSNKNMPGGNNGNNGNNGDRRRDGYCVCLSFRLGCFLCCRYLLLVVLLIASVSNLANGASVVLGACSNNEMSRGGSSSSYCGSGSDMGELPERSTVHWNQPAALSTGAGDSGGDSTRLVGTALALDVMLLELSIGSSRARIGSRHAEIVDPDGHAYRAYHQAGTVKITYDDYNVLQLAPPDIASGRNSTTALTLDGTLTAQDVHISSPQAIASLCAILRRADASTSMPCSGPQSIQVALAALAGSNASSATDAASSTSATAQPGVSEDRLKRLLVASESTARSQISKTETALSDKLSEAVEKQKKEVNRRMDEAKEGATKEVRLLAARLTAAEGAITQMGTVDERVSEKNARDLWQTGTERELRQAQESLLVLQRSANNGTFSVVFGKLEKVAAEVSAVNATAGLRHHSLSAVTTDLTAQVAQLKGEALEATALYANRDAATNSSLEVLTARADLADSRIELAEGDLTAAMELLLAQIALVAKNLTAVSSNSSQALAVSNSIMAKSVHSVNLTLVEANMEVDRRMRTALQQLNISMSGALAGTTEALSESVAEVGVTVTELNSTLHVELKGLQGTVRDTVDSLEARMHRLNVTLVGAIATVAEEAVEHFAVLNATGAAALVAVEQNMQARLMAAEDERMRAMLALETSLTSAAAVASTETADALAAVRASVAATVTTMASDAVSLRDEIARQLREAAVNTTTAIDASLVAVAQRVDILQTATKEQIDALTATTRSSHAAADVAAASAAEKVTGIAARVTRLEEAQQAAAELVSANREKLAKLEGTFETVREQRVEHEQQLNAAAADVTALKTRAASNEDRSKGNEETAASLRDRVTKLETLVEMLLKK